MSEHALGFNSESHGLFSTTCRTEDWRFHVKGIKYTKITAVWI